MCLRLCSCPMVLGITAGKISGMELQSAGVWESYREQMNRGSLEKLPTEVVHQLNSGLRDPTHRGINLERENS